MVQTYTLSRHLVMFPERSGQDKGTSLSGPPTTVPSGVGVEVLVKGNKTKSRPIPKHLVKGGYEGKTLYGWVDADLLEKVTSKRNPPRKNTLVQLYQSARFHAANAAAPIYQGRGTADPSQLIHDFAEFSQRNNLSMYGKEVQKSVRSQYETTWWRAAAKGFGAVTDRSNPGSHMTPYTGPAPDWENIGYRAFNYIYIDGQKIGYLDRSQVGMRDRLWLAGKRRDDDIKAIMYWAYPVKAFQESPIPHYKLPRARSVNSAWISAAEQIRRGWNDAFNAQYRIPGQHNPVTSEAQRRLMQAAAHGYVQDIPPSVGRKMLRDSNPSVPEPPNWDAKPEAKREWVGEVVNAARSHLGTKGNSVVLRVHSGVTTYTNPDDLKQGKGTELLARRGSKWITYLFGTYTVHFLDYVYGRKTRKGNPEARAANLYEKFHGRPSEEVIDVVEEVHEHEWLSPLGDLVELCVHTETNLKLEMSWDPQQDNMSTPILAANEDGTQLYIRGGDQSIDLAKIKMGDGTKWHKEKMMIGEIHLVTYRTQKEFDKFVDTDYFHEVGEVTKERPFLVYDSVSCLMEIVGGQYHIDMPLIGVSRGIIN